MAIKDTDLFYGPIYFSDYAFYDEAMPPAKLCPKILYIYIYYIRYRESYTIARAKRKCAKNVEGGDSTNSIFKAADGG